MLRPPRDQGDPKAIDESTDTYDTIDWLLKNVPNNNGRVGMLGISYAGWLTVMAMLDPHPALKAVSPQASPADMFLGDDFHHNGAFRLSYGFEYVAMMETDKDQRQLQVRPPRHLRVVSAARRALRTSTRSTSTARCRPGTTSSPTPTTTSSGRSRPFAPTSTRVDGADAERRRLVGPGGLLRPAQDLRAAREARHQEPELPRRRPLEPRRLVSAATGRQLGKIAFDSPTGKHFRDKVQAPLFAYYLKDKGDARPARGADCSRPAATQWVPPRPLAAAQRRHDRSSSTSSRDGTPVVRPPAGRPRPTTRSTRTSPTRPTRCRTGRGRSRRPIPAARNGRSGWSRTSASPTHRPDVLTYETEPLTEDVTVAGDVSGPPLRLDHRAPTATGSSKLIDVYPDEYPQRRRPWAATSS